MLFQPLDYRLKENHRQHLLDLCETSNVYRMVYHELEKNVLIADIPYWVALELMIIYDVTTIQQLFN